jgi:alkylated DNA repair protein alkB family protein 5
LSQQGEELWIHDQQDKYGNPPGILHEEAVDPLPQLLRNTIKRLVRWHVLPTTCVPDSCIINIYDEGDCIPPHIDHHDFVRPFCTLSLLGECCILFGGNLKIIGPGSFDGPVSIPLPVG